MPRICRRFLVDPTEVGIYHCVNRGVRRSFLCGKDPVSGKDYEHRRQWMQDRIQFLAGQFGVDVLGFAVPSARASNKGCLPMSFAEYLDLLDWTGRQLREDKRGAIPSDLAPILERLQISNDGWMQLMGRFRRMFRRAAGRPQSMQLERDQRGARLMQGIRHSRAIFC